MDVDVDVRHWSVAHLAADVSFFHDVFLAEKEFGFDGESQQFSEAYLSVLEQRHL